LGDESKKTTTKSNRKGEEQATAKTKANTGVLRFAQK
jgi:hypothetical protein